MRNLYLAVLIFCSSSFLFGQTGNQVNFDGTDYVVLDNVIGDLVGEPNFTIEFWIKGDLNDNLAGPSYIFSINPYNGGADNKIGIFMGDGINPQNGAITFYDASTSPYYLVSTVIAGDDSCHHIAYVKTGSTVEGFIDGVSFGTQTVGYTILSNDRMSLGHEWDAGTPSNFYNGNIDELRIWDVARTQSQIQTYMHTSLTGSESGLVAYYNFDQGIAAGNNTGLTTLNDLTTNNNDGTLNNFTLNGSTSNWVSEVCNIEPPAASSDNALNFDGTDYVVLDNAISELVGQPNFTIEFWMKGDLNDNLADGAYMFAINPYNGGPDNKMGIFMGNGVAPQNGAVTFYDVTTSPYFMVSSQIIGNDSCHHIAYVKTGSSVEGFIDGVSFGTQTVGYTIAANDRMSLGHEWDAGATSNVYNGNIDELRIWTVARTQIEIQSNMHASLTGSEPNLVAYYNFNQGISAGNNVGLTTLNDLTSYNNDGTLNNFTLNGATSNWVASYCKGDVGVESIELSSYFRIYPNPATGNVYIENESLFSGRLQITDMCGRIMYSSSFDGNHSIDVSSYPVGVYNLVLRTADGVANYKLIKS